MFVLKCQDREDVIFKLCKLIESIAKENIKKNNVFNIGVSGGSLVSFLTKGLPNIRTDFTKWRIFFCDERLVPIDDPESTFGLYKKQLIDSKVINLTQEQFVIVKQNVSAEEAAKIYAEEIAKYIPCNPLPQFDMLLLGMGPDGHTCSLFPSHVLLKETSKWVVPITDSPKPPSIRVTLTLPVVNNAKVCVFAVCGKDKANMLKRILVDKEDLPAGKVRPISGKVHWLVDQEAGVYLSETKS